MYMYIHVHVHVLSAAQPNYTQTKQAAGQDQTITLRIQAGQAPHFSIMGWKGSKQQLRG